MGSEFGQTRGPTSPAYDMFQVMFQGTDMISSFWQPMLKGVGRWQLEIAQAGTRQTRAAMALGQRVVRATGPGDVLEAYRDYWTDVSGVYSDASRNIATAIVRAAPHAAVLELPVTPRKHVHDRLEISDTPPAQTDGNAWDYQRKVA